MAKRGPKPKGPTSASEFIEFEKLLGMQCTLEEVAAWFNVDVKTIQARCEEYYQEKFSQLSLKKRDFGKISLRRRQWQKAMEGNVTMLIWLGKQYLNQVEKVEPYTDDLRRDPLEDMTIAELHDEIEKKAGRFDKVKLKNRDLSKFESELVEKAKKRSQREK